MNNPIENKFEFFSLCFGKREGLALALREVALSQFTSQLIDEELIKAEQNQPKHVYLPDNHPIISLYKSSLQSIAEITVKSKARIKANAFYEDLRAKLLYEEIKL